MNAYTGKIHDEPTFQTPTQFSAFVGYVRVSSKRQASDGGGLVEQRAELEAYSREYGAELLGPHEDTLSGYKPTSSRRPGLRAAIEQAVRRNVPLLVARVDRLTRSPNDLDLLDRDDLVIVATDRGVVDRAVLKAAVAKAQVQSDTKKRNAQNQHARRRSRSGRVVPQAFDPGRKVGAQSNKTRAVRRVEELADYLRANPDARQLTPHELMERLNSTGPLNLKSVHGLRDPWTREALRPVRRAAENILTGAGPCVFRLDSTVPSSASQAIDADVATGAEPSFKEMPLGDLARNVLQMDCSQARPLTKEERTLLAEIIKADLSGKKMLTKTTINFLMKVLRAHDDVLPEVKLVKIHGFVRPWVHLHEHANASTG